MPNNALSGKPVTLSLIAIACIAAVGGIAFIVIGMQSPLTGDEKGVQNQTKTNISWYHKCDLNCKTNWEKMGLTCFTESDGNFLCKSASRFTIHNVIPGGSEKMPYQRNFIQDSIKVSLEINSTVSWANIDDFPHRVISDDGLFDSGIILPNQTWGHAFDKVGEYHYHDDHPWLKGLVIVVPIDSNYRNLDGEPIGKNTNDPTINYVIFRETDHWGNVQKVSVLDSNTVSVLLHDYRSTDDKETIQKTLKIGARMVESCYVESDHIVIGNLILERIVDTNTPFAEFRDFATIESGTSCSFDDLMKVT